MSRPRLPSIEQVVGIERHPRADVTRFFAQIECAKSDCTVSDFFDQRFRTASSTAALSDRRMVL